MEMGLSMAIDYLAVFVKILAQFFLNLDQI